MPVAILASMATDKTGAQTTVTDVPAEQRYEISVDGSTVGLTAYRDRATDDAGQRVFFHTEVDDAYGGRGLGTILVREALDDTISRGLRIVGVCPLVAAFLKKNPDYADKADKVTPDILSWLQSRI